MRPVYSEASAGSRGGDEDWRSQMDSKYSGSEYNDLLPGASSSGKIYNHHIPESLTEFSYTDLSVDNAAKTVVDAYRFPPVPAVPLPSEILPKDYEQDFDLRGAFDPINCSAEESESIAALDFLEGMLQTMIEKAVDTRSSLLENGEYIYSLANPPTAEEIEYLKTVIAENLNILREECLEIIAEMDDFEAENVNDMIIAGEDSAGMVIHQLKQSLLERSTALKNEVAASAIILDGIALYASSISNHPSQRICKIDGIMVDWSPVDKMQEMVKTSNRSLHYAEFMRAQGLPVCSQIYSFLQSTAAHGYQLIITDYSFRPGELKTFLAFMDQHDSTVLTGRGGDGEGTGTGGDNLQPRKSVAAGMFLSEKSGPSVRIYPEIHKLVIQNCGLSDRDCHSLASRLFKLTHLISLNLRDNKLTYSGVASMAAALYDCGSSMRSLRLDGNNIKADGALVLAQVLHKMPLLEIFSLGGNPIKDKGMFYLLKYCLNPERSAYAELPRPGFDSLTQTKKQKHQMLSSLVATGQQGGGSLSFEDDDDDDTELNAPGGGPDPFLDNSPETAEKRAFRRKVMKKCYFDNYFRFHYTFLGTARDAYAAEEDEAAAQERARKDKEHWINQEEDEFYMDARSDYSASDDDEDDEGGDADEENNSNNDQLSTSGAADDHDDAETSRDSDNDAVAAEGSSIISLGGGRRGAGGAGGTRKLRRHSAQTQAQEQDGRSQDSMDIVSAAVEKKQAHLLTVLADKRAHVYRDAPRLVQLFMKLRVKLIAVNAFARLLRTGCMISSLGVAGCSLSVEVVPTVVKALIDNKNIISFDASDNPHFLRSFTSCQQISELVESGGLRTLRLNNCGIPDRGFMEITTAASNATGLRNLELSGNNIGPTGINWAGTASKVFYADALDISGGFHASAPFRKRAGDPSSFVGSSSANAATSFGDMDLDSTFEGDYGREGRRGEAGEGSGGDADYTGGDKGGDFHSEDDDDSVGTYKDTDLFDGEDEGSDDDDRDDDRDDYDDGDSIDDEESGAEGYDNFDENASIGASTLISGADGQQHTANGGGGGDGASSVRSASILSGAGGSTAGAGLRSLGGWSFARGWGSGAGSKADSSSARGARGGDGGQRTSRSGGGGSSPNRDDGDDDSDAGLHSRISIL